MNKRIPFIHPSARVQVKQTDIMISTVFWFGYFAVYSHRYDEKRHNICISSICDKTVNVSVCVLPLCGIWVCACACASKLIILFKGQSEKKLTVINALNERLWFRTQQHTRVYVTNRGKNWPSLIETRSKLIKCQKDIKTQRLQLAFTCEICALRIGDKAKRKRLKFGNR